MPPNELNPETLAEHAAALAGEHEHLTAEALGPAEMDALGMGALAAVGRGSINPPRLVVLRYEPPKPTSADLVLGLVGKSITFDTGGISIKPAGGMEAMKGDMAGGAGDAARHRRDRRARAARPCRRRARRGGEHAGRRRVPARRHPARRERQDDRDHQHRRRGTARARGRALVRAARGRDARHRPRDAHGRDGARARRPVRRLLRERRRVARPHRRRGRAQRRPRVAASRCTRATAATSTPRSRT